MSTSPPTTLGKYDIIREIARSNDIVYEAYDPLMNRRVAVKELAIPQGSTQQQIEDRIKRFEREVKAAGSLGHPNIVTIYEVGQDQGRHFMAMEFLDGRTLRSELDSRGYLEQDRAIEIALEVLDALDFAHQHGVVHRDIKPENIQITETGRIKLTDFGIARLTFEPNLTIDGQVFGTPSYMSPEQVVGKDIDPRSDLFSLGVVLYEMVGGQKPFAGDSVVSITYAIMNKEPEPPAQVSGLLWPAIQRALEKSPQLRYTSAGEMRRTLKDLRSALSQGGAVLPPPSFSLPTVAPQTAPGYPYNPYQAAPPPVASAPPVQTGGPILTPYSPNGQSGYAPNGQPYQPNTQPYQPFGASGVPQVPVYYPPPPRQPLLKAETKRFLARLTLTILLVGTLLALLIVGIGAIGRALERYSLEQTDRELVVQLSQQRESTPLPTRISEARSVLSRLKGSATRTQAAKHLAALLQRQGQGQLNTGRLAEAENSINEALTLDPDNPDLAQSLESVYAAYGKATGDPRWLDRVPAPQPNEAGRVAPPLASYNEREAENYFNQAVATANEGNRQEARDLLYRARRNAIPHTQLYQRIEDAIRELSGY